MVMGILSGSDNGRLTIILATLQRWSLLVCLLLYLGGIIYGSVILWPSVSQNTYFSENALIPGIVDEHFSSHQTIATLRNDVRIAANAAKNRTQSGMPVAWLVEQFESMGVETFVHEFAVQLPFSSAVIRGSNVYAIVRAPRGASLESIVVATPFKQGVYGPLSVFLPFVQYCQRQIYWAKDIIFVVNDHSHLGMQAWLSAYHGRENAYINGSSLLGRGGSIQAGIVLDSDKFNGQVTHMNIEYSMVNGKLPNLDLLNLAVKMSNKEGFRATVHHQEDYLLNEYTLQGYLHYAKTAAQAIFEQASGTPQGVHSVFGSFGIEALTVKANQRKPSGEAGAYSFNNVGRMLEGSLRSVNNLLERLHQSFFFYVLLSPHKFVSIGIYIASVLLMALAVLVKSACLWVDLDKCVDTFLRSVPFILLCHVYGCVILWVPTFLNQWSHSSPLILDPPHLLFTSSMAIAGGLLIFPVMLSMGRGHLWTNAVSDMVRCFMLLELSLLLGATALLNFGLALVTSLIVTPPFIVLKCVKSRWLRVLNTWLVIFLHPLSIVLLYSVIVCPWTVSVDAILPIAEHVYNTVRSLVLGVLLDQWVYGSWMYAWICMGLIPLWTQLWLLVTNQTQASS